MLLSRLLLPAFSLIVTPVCSEKEDSHSCISSSTAALSEHKCQVVNLTNLVSKIKTSQANRDQVTKKRIYKRQVGRASSGGCGNPLLSQIMQHVVGPLQSVNQLKLGDVAKILQQSVQQATGKSYEILMGKGEMATASHQMSESASCKLRIGDYYTSVHETPVQYNINNVQQEQELSSIDFGENLGSSGYPGQTPFPRWSETPIEKLLNLQGLIIQAECFSGDLIVETVQGPKRMRDLNIGDEVLSIDENTITFSPIIMSLHRDDELLAEFNVITTASGDEVKLTNEHLIYTVDCNAFNVLRLVKAKEVTTDDCVLVARSPGRKLSASRVTNVSKVYERGIYAPLTMTGDIIANDVLSSCHSNLAVRTLQNSFFKIYRSFSFMLPEEHDELPYGIELFTSALDLFVPTKTVFA